MSARPVLAAALLLLMGACCPCRPCAATVQPRAPADRGALRTVLPPVEDSIPRSVR